MGSEGTRPVWENAGDPPLHGPREGPDSFQPSLRWTEGPLHSTAHGNTCCERTGRWHPLWESLPRRPQGAPLEESPAPRLHSWRHH